MVYHAGLGECFYPDIMGETPTSPAEASREAFETMQPAELVRRR